MAATLIESRKLTLDSGAIIQIRVWRLPAITEERPHGLKYSLYYAHRGTRIIGYDNEHGKGNHRHYRDREEAYRFTTFEKLVSDFWEDVRREIGRE